MTTLIRMALEEARDALIAALGPTVGTPVFKDVSLAIASADKALGESHLSTGALAAATSPEYVDRTLRGWSKSADDKTHE